MFSSIAGIVLESCKYCVIILIPLHTVEERKKTHWNFFSAVKIGFSQRYVWSICKARSSLLPPVPAQLPLLPVAAQAAWYRKDLPNLCE